MMDHAIHGRRRRHRVFEDLIPFAKHQIARDHDRAALIPFGEQREEHLHLLATLLHIAEIIEDQRLETVQSFEFRREAEIALGGEQPLHDLEGGGKEHEAALPHEL